MSQRPVVAADPTVDDRGRVLVTGGSGFIGSKVVEQLVLRGYEVHVVSRTTDRSRPGVHRHRGDLLDPSAADRLLRAVAPDSLVHLAWVTEHQAFWHAEENWAWIEASIRLGDRFAAGGGRRMTVAGTCAEYDWSRSPMVEDATPLLPDTPYGTAKLQTFERLSTLADRTGMELAWGRIFFAFGPGEQPGRLVPYVARHLLAERRAHVTAGDQQRDFLYVDDLARAFAMLHDGHVTGAVNMASGVGVSVSEVVDCVARAVGRPDLVARDATLHGGSEPATLTAEVVRLREEVGFVPAWELDSAVRTTVDWWRRHAPGDAGGDFRPDPVDGSGSGA